MSDPFGPYTLPGYAASIEPFQPGGYLTLVSGSPVITSDQTSKTIVYYAQDKHNAFPVIKNGTRHAVYFDEPRLVLSSAHTASGICDVFGVERNGKGHMVTGPLWSTATAGSGARGTGGGTTELTRAGGMRVNRWGIPGLNGDGSQFIAPLEGTYLGSLFFDGSNGQVSCHVSYGQSRKWGVWNAYNRKSLLLKAGDSTTSWTYSTSTIRAANNASANSLTAFCGLAEEAVTLHRLQYTLQSGSNSHTVALIGENSTTASSGSFAAMPGTVGIPASGSARYARPPFLGVNVYTALEQATGTGTATWSGTEAQCLIEAQWRG